MSNENDKTCPQQTVAELMSDRVGEQPDRNFLIFQDRTWTYQQFHAITNQLAAAFIKQGAKPGEHIAILLPNSPEFLFCFFGAIKAGCVATPLNTLLKADELEYIINHSDAKILCTTPRYRKLLDPVWDKLEHIQRLVLTEASPDYEAALLEQWIADGDPTFVTSTKGENKAVMIYTSGTTGRPKGVLLSQSNLLYNSFVAHKLIDLRPEDVSLCIMPLFHVNAQVASTLATLQAGATMVLEEMFKPRSFIRTLKKYKCTTFSGVPAIYSYLNDMKEAQGEDLGFLKACICGAAPLPVEVFRTFEERFGAKILEGYGLSEGTCVSTLNPLVGERKIGSIGLTIPGQEIAIWDENEKPLPDGEVGEIVIRGPNCMLGYYKNPEANESSIRNGWLRTGDQAYRDQDGYYFIAGRKKEMIIRGGENIYPREIEEVLYEHDDIQDCAVVGVPDKKYGEEVIAFIVARPGSGISEKEIRRYLRQKIADFKRPKHLELVHDLPRTATGKIQKQKIIEEYVGNLKLINQVKGNVRINYRWVYGSALGKFYTGLKNEGKFYGTRCPECKRVQLPPKSHCAICYEECTEWLELPNRGVLESFTGVHMAFPGQPKKPPYTYGYIKLEGSNTHMYHLIDEIDEDDVKLGMLVEAVWEEPEKRKGALYDIRYFRPLANQGKA